MSDITTPEGRKRERIMLEKVYDEGCPYAETDDCRCGYMEMMRRALDGLDIAEEMAEMLKAYVLLAEYVEREEPPSYRLLQARERLAKWDTWKGN